jgi:hypothetical protein
MYNWKNVQYANSSGILSAMAENNKQAAAGRQQIVDSITGFGDAYSELQTGKATAALAGASTPEQAQDIFNQYQQGANGFVDQTALAENFRTQTKEFRDIRESDANMAYKNSQLELSKANTGIAQGKLDIQNRVQDRMDDILNRRQNISPTDPTTNPDNAMFGSVMNNYSSARFGQAQTEDTLLSNSGVNYGLEKSYKTNRQAAVTPLLTKAISNISSLTGKARDVQRAKDLLDIDNSGFQPDFKQNLKKQYLDGIKNIRANEEIVVTRDQKNYMTNVTKEINNTKSTPSTVEGWKDKFTEISLNGNMTKAEAAKKFLPQLTTSMRGIIKKHYQQEQFTDADGKSKDKLLRSGPVDDNFALEIIQNRGMQVGISQFVQSLGLDKATNETILNSLNENLGVTSLQKSRKTTFDAAVEAKAKYEKKKEKDTFTLNNNTDFNKMLGPVDKYQGAHEDVGEAFNLLQQDGDLHAAGFLNNKDIFYKEMRYFNPGADNDTFGADTGSSMTGDFEIGTMAKQSGDLRDYSLGRTAPDLLTRLKNHNKDEKSPDHVTVEEIKAAQWRTDEPTEVALIMKIVSLQALKIRNATESAFDNAIRNYK